MRLLSFVIGVPTIWAACNQCPFPSFNVTAFLPCLKPVIGEDCCVTGRPLVNDPCIKVWLKNPQLVPYVSIINKAQVACNVNQLAPCTAAVAAACPAECGASAAGTSSSMTTSQTTSSSSSGKGQQMQNGQMQNGQMQNGQRGQSVTQTTSSSSSSSSGGQMQNMQMQNQSMQNNCTVCPFPDLNMTAFQACLGPNITQACCPIRRPFVSDPCSKVWLASPQMAPYAAQLAQSAKICNATLDQVIPCNVSVAQACPSQCALPPNCSQVCPLPSLNMTAFAPCLGSTINQSCCTVARPLISNACAKAWLANPVIASIASILTNVGTACNLMNQVPTCNASVAQACPSACVASLGIFSNHSSSNFTFNSSQGAQSGWLAQNAWQAQSGAQAQNGTQTPCQAQAAAQQSACAGRLGCSVVRCNQDGSFSSLQCSGSTGQCWCVDSMGNEIANTRNGATAAGQTNCTMLANSTMVNSTTTVNTTVVNTTTTTSRISSSTAGKIAKAGKRFKAKKAKNGGSP